MITLLTLSVELPNSNSVVVISREIDFEVKLLVEISYEFIIKN